MTTINELSRYTFKAKRKDNQEWVYGLLIRKRDLTFNNEYDEFYAIQDDFFEEYRIDEQTLSQCTGLQDIEGNYIFENDIVNIYFKKTNILNAIAEVIYKDYSFKLETPGYILADHNWEEDLKIIGNKFDNE